MTARAIWQSRHGEDDRRPYMQLWAHVLWQAVTDLVRSPDDQPSAIQVREEAAEWILCDADCVGSFRWVCDLMHLDPDKVRERITRMVVMSGGQRFRMPKFITQAAQ